VGPLAGPVVAAAVVPGGYRFKSRIDDSKRLTARARKFAYEEIVGNCAYSVAVVSREAVDLINIHNASRLAMEKAIIGLAAAPDYVLVDGRSGLFLPRAGRSVKSGDRKCLSIACASIVAKVRRDRIMEGLDRLYPKYGFIRHKGYGTAAHFRTLKKYGPSPVHRLSFEPVKSMAFKAGKDKRMFKRAGYKRT